MSYARLENLSWNITLKRRILILVFNSHPHPLRSVFCYWRMKFNILKFAAKVSDFWRFQLTRLKLSECSDFDLIEFKVLIGYSLMNNIYFFNLIYFPYYRGFEEISGVTCHLKNNSYFCHRFVYSGDFDFRGSFLWNGE